MIIKKILNRSYKYRLFINKMHSRYSLEKMKDKVNKKYICIFNKDINWDNPQTYNEKINVAKLLFNTDLKTKCTDKYEVREIVKERIGEQYLIPLINVYKSFDEINFEDLPSKFVMKMNNDSGSVYICKDKNNLNYKKIKKRFDYYLKRNFAYELFELHYVNIKPLILIEPLIEESIRDYKFLCFDGIPYYCRVDFDRFGNHTRNIYDLKWNLQDFNKGKYSNCEQEIKKPEKFDEMKKLVQKLCVGFDQVRVDMYDVNGKIYFGEMTFTNGAGMEKFYPDEKDIEIGNLWNLRK